MYVACNGVVYDVTDCPKWYTGLHEYLLWPGQDLTNELPNAPHDEEVFSYYLCQARRDPAFYVNDNGTLIFTEAHKLLNFY